MRVARSRVAIIRNVASLAALLIVLLTGCGLPWPFLQPTPDPNLPAPDAQQVLRPLASGPNAGDLDTLDPAQIQFGLDSGMAQLIFPQLVTLDEKQQPVDWAAESHTISADGLTYTFHLHQGMAWADGTPIDANAFAYSINRALDPCLGSGVAYYLLDLTGAVASNSGACPPGAIKSTVTLIGLTIQTPDPLTLRLTLAHPAGYFLSALTYPTSYAVPQALIERYTQPGYSPSPPAWIKHLLDDGPFGGNLYLLTKWQLTQSTDRGSLIFERNERFWGKKPLLHRIEYTLYPHASDAWSGFAQGKGDVASILPAQYATTRLLKGVTVQHTPMLSNWYLKPNWQFAPFDDVRVRQAFSLALDRNALILKGFGSAQPDLPPETIRAYRQPTIHLVPDGMPGYNPALADTAGRTGMDALTPDLEAARKLASAYAGEKCGGAYAKCPPVFIPILDNRDSNMTLVQAMIAQWQHVFPGWVMGQTWYAHTQLRPEYQMELWGWGADYPDPQDFLSLLWTTRAQYNQEHVSLSQVDKLLAQADGMSDQRARISPYQQAEQLLVNNGAAIPLHQNFQNYAVRSHVSGWSTAPTGVTPLSVWQSTYIRR